MVRLFYVQAIKGKKGFIMKETRRLYIKKKVFTKSDILNIGQILLSEYQSAQKAKNRSSITFQLNCVDGTSYESESTELFDNGSIIDLKRTGSLEMSFHDYELDRYIIISVTPGGGEYGNHLIVRGDDRNWVDGVFTRSKEIVDSVKPQENWILKYKTLILHVSALGIGIIIYSVFNFVLDGLIEPIEIPSETVKAIQTFFKTYPLFLYLLVWFLKWCMGISLAPYLRGWLLNLWPEIEFDFGPEHMKVEKERRLRILIVFSTVVIPIVLAIGYDIVKSLLMK
jgi:hypothetical protein